MAQEQSDADEEEALAVPDLMDWDNFEAEEDD